MPSKKREWWKNLPPELLGNEQQQAPGAPAPIGAAPGAGGAAPAGVGGFTGLGPDGVAQPERRVPPGIGSPATDKHEAEYVFNANETQAIGQDVLMGMAKAVKDGTLDVNQIRGAIGQQPKQGLAIGTFSRVTNPDISSIGAGIKDQVDQGVEGAKVDFAIQNADNKFIPGTTVDGPGLAIGDPISDTPKQTLDVNPIGAGPTSVDAEGRTFATGALPQQNDGSEYADQVAGTANAAIAGETDYSADVAKTANAAIADENATLAGQSAAIGGETDPLANDPAIVADAEADNVTPEEYLQNVLNGTIPSAAAQEAIMRQGGAAAAALGAAKQEMAQAGVGLLGRATLTQQQIRAGEGGRSDLFGKLAATAQGQQMAAAQALLSEEHTDDAMAWAKEQYGDTEYTRMAGDIANGMPLDQAIAKYPNLTEEDYGKISDHVNYAADQQRIADAEEALGSYVGKMDTDPDWFTQGKWMEDPGAIRRLSDIWNAEGFEGEFDINDPQDAAWARSQMEPYTLTAVEVEMGQIKAGAWYQGLSDEDKSDMDDIMNFGVMMSVTGGYDLGENADGSLYLVDSAGDVVYGNRAAIGGDGVDTPTGGVTNESVTEAYTTLGEQGVTTTSNRVRQYMLEHDGAAPVDIDEYLRWDQTAGDPLNVLRYFNGDPSVNLTSADRGQIGLAIAAKERVAADPENATTEDMKLAQLVPFEITTNPAQNDVNRLAHKVWDPGGGMGNNRREISGDSSIYGGAEGNGNSVSFEPHVTEWAQQNAGGLVQIEGVWYRLDATQPIAEHYNFDTISLTSGNDTRKQPFYADALVLRALDDPNTPVYYTFGCSATYDDN